ncbi:MAG: PQQ-binding-like beta-propeller repeat protein [Planctomycetales bacterium]|nr:PQQ-binding-like beta-propeller repeat protein [Planctomycetales bacterium]
MKLARQLLLAVMVVLLVGCGTSSPPADTSTTSDETASAPASPAASPSDAEATPAAASAGQPTASETSDVPDKADPAALASLPAKVDFSPEDWPQYRGVRRDGASQETSLRGDWPEAGPPVLWRTSAGEGYSAPSVVGDRVYFNDYDEQRNVWMVRCLALDTGDEVWKYEVGKRIRPNHGITRSAPVVNGACVVSIDPKCELHCLNAATGAPLWRKHLPQEFGGQIPAWYNGQCPLLDGDKLVLAPGGRALLAAWNVASGELLWETPNSENWTLSHSSPTPVTLDGVAQYAYTTLQGLIGVDASTGALLWQFPWKFNTAVPTMPLPMDDGKFFLTSGYHARTVVCQVVREGDQFTAHEVTSLPPPTNGWNSEVHTPLYYRGFVWGVGKKQRGLWTCLSPDGEELWTSPRGTSFGMGGYALADGKFFVLEGTTGMLRILDAQVDEYRELAHFQLIEGGDVWAPPIISHGRLLIRDSHQLACLDLRGGEPLAATESDGETTAQNSPATR